MDRRGGGRGRRPLRETPPLIRANLKNDRRWEVIDRWGRAWRLEVLAQEWPFDILAVVLLGVSEELDITEDRTYSAQYLCHKIDQNEIMYVVNTCRRLIDQENSDELMDYVALNDCTTDAAAPLAVRPGPRDDRDLIHFHTKFIICNPDFIMLNADSSFKHKHYLIVGRVVGDGPVKSSERTQRIFGVVPTADREHGAVHVVEVIY